MVKKKISKKHALLWNDIEEADVDVNKIRNLKTIDTEAFFKNHAKIGSALLESLIANDTEAFIEILDQYLKVNRSQVARSAHIGRSTVQAVLSKKGNPTLKTIAKIVHHSAMSTMKNASKR